MGHRESGWGHEGPEASGRRPLRAAWLMAGALGVVVLAAAACSSSATSTTTTAATPGGSKSGPAQAATVAAARVGSVGTVLVDSSGMTLYRFTPDGTGKSTCTGGCASIWPPLTVPAGSTPPAGSGLTGSDLGTITRSDGTTQVTYKGWPLYTYTGDKATGEANGQGVANTWFVVAASSTASPAAGGTTTTTKAGGGSGGYGY
jgi:predicted lipoprotein with Yx(FWY)xxD motif